MLEQIPQIIAQLGTFGIAIALSIFLMNKLVDWIGKLKGRSNGNGNGNAALTLKLNSVCAKVDKLDDKLNVLLSWHEPENGEQVWKGTRIVRGLNDILEKLKDLDNDYKNRYKHLSDKVEKIGSL